MSSGNNEIVLGPTLYLNNLNEKIKLDDLKSLLFELFSTYGDIIDIVAQRGIRKKGQAFVVFSNTLHAKQALIALDGFSLLGKDIKVQYAIKKSRATEIHDGSFVYQCTTIRRAKGTGQPMPLQVRINVDNNS